MSSRFVVMVGVVFAIVVAVPMPVMAEATDKNEGTPDFCQTDRDGQFENGGRTFCGPVAMSNSIMWFAHHGYPRLIDEKAAEKETQIELIRTLASPEYMRTSTEGTGAQKLMEGAAKYVTERGQKFAKLEYRGWRSLDKQYKPSESRPSLEWISQTMANPRGGACVNIGWYTHDDATDTYTRHGGHWMTATGVDADAAKSMIELHDPAPRSGKGQVTHHAHVELLTKGTLAGSEKRPLASADGLFVIRDGIVPKEVVKGEKTYPIIDGVVVMALE